MRAIYSLWSRPRPRGVALLSALERLLVALSVSSWRRHNGPALLYCDRPYARYLDRVGLLELWDEIDTDILEAVDTRIDAPTFWTAGRLAAIAAAPVPFVSLDCDLVVWRELGSELSDRVVGFTHWESTEPSPWYPAPARLSTPPDFRIRADRDWTLGAANTSIVFFGAASVRDQYAAEALTFVTGNPGRLRADAGVAPELLFAEQRLLPVIAEEAGVPAAPLIDALWSPRRDRFVGHDSRYGEWDPLRAVDQPAGITHGWFHKTLLADGDPRRLRLVRELEQLVRSDHPELAPRLGIV